MYVTEKPMKYCWNPAFIFNELTVRIRIKNIHFEICQFDMFQSNDGLHLTFNFGDSVGRNIYGDVHSMWLEIMIGKPIGSDECCIAHRTVVWFFRCSWKCLFRPWRSAKRLPHFSQAYGFSSVCQKMNSLKLLQNHLWTDMSAHMSSQFFRRYVSQFAQVAFHFEIVVMILKVRL